MTTKQTDITKMSFENAVSELEEIINKFESEQINLDEAIKNYSRAEKLRAHCTNKLSEAKLKVEQITEGKDGEISTKIFKN